jgi:hypothetical protein
LTRAAPRSACAERSTRRNSIARYPASIPAPGEALGRVLTARVPGFDLTFSAPKSVRVLFGIGDDKLRAVLRDAHDRAVLEAVGYIERFLLFAGSSG